MGLIEFLTGFLVFLNRVIVPLLMTIAFLMFIINAVRYFIIESAEEDGREKAKQLAIYGIAAFVIITSIWGIVNLISKDIFPQTRPITPDYFEKSGTGGGFGGGSGSGIGTPTNSVSRPGPSGLEEEDGYVPPPTDESGLEDDGSTELQNLYNQIEFR